ncbi:MAG TPA: YceH family protein [Lysobacter sp.]
MSDPEVTQPPQLSPIEARAVASLIEKQATTPDVYPLTLNAIVLACNQKTAREPTMQLDPGEVGHALRQLEGRGWVKAQHGGRADRYEHRFDTLLGITRPQASLLALLMLRGPQTAYELLTRCERMASFEGVEDVQHALGRLAQRDPALVREIPRQGGQREDRYAHLLSGEPVIPVASSRATSSASTTPSLDGRVEALESRVGELEAQLARLLGESGSGSDAS